MGLSLADIVKAWGELKVETKETRPPARAGTDGDEPRLTDSLRQAVGRGEGSEFIISLPIQ
jgi:hypothetical protein